MSYQTYTTDAIVCGSYNRMTADRTYLLFTEVAGMVYATARSAREERSKQRYALQDFAYIRITLVKGKHGWRIGSVEALGNFYTAAPNRAARGAVVYVVSTLRRLVTGEEANQKVFADTYTVLKTITEAATTQLQDVQDIYTLRLLASLGYIGVPKTFSEWLESTDCFTNPVPLSKQAQQAITSGLSASHL